VYESRHAKLDHGARQFCVETTSISLVEAIICRL